LRITDVIVTCNQCHKEFRLFSDDAAEDLTICWNFCPYCGARKDVWLRFFNPKSRIDSEIKIGVGSIEAFKLR
jgi:hypothetical protein